MYEGCHPSQLITFNANSSTGIIRLTQKSYKSQIAFVSSVFNSPLNEYGDTNKMDIRRRVPIVFRPHLELSEPQNCTALENVNDFSDGYNGLVYILCAVIIVLHVKHHSAVGSTFLFGLVASTIGLALTPVLVAISLVFAVYRRAVKKILRKQPGFAGLMEGSDAYWAGEQIYARSIINIMGMIDCSKMVSEGQRPIDAVRGVMKRVMEGKSQYKMTCKKRMSPYGYWYLEKCDINLEENVRFIEPDLRGKRDLEQFMSEVANDPLIKDTFWEVLVGREPLEELGRSYPVIWRVHHAMGDGYALVKMFLDSMTDSDGRMHKFVRKESVLQRLVNGEYKQRFIPYVITAFNMVFVYIYTMVVLAEQLLMPPDMNSLHNRLYLSGKKVCRWVKIDLETVKEVRRALNCRFTDVVLTALSNSLEGCFVRWGENVENVKVVIPARLPGATGSGSMTNLFTVAMLEIPVTGKDKLTSIQQKEELLRKLPDFLVNYWLLRVAFTIFPASFLVSAVTSRHSTLAISNMPGPKSRIKVAGCNVTDLTFWLPNRDTTGVGISFLSYANTFNIGISVDSSLMSTPDQADQILDGIANSIKQMHSLYVSNGTSKGQMPKDQELKQFGQIIGSEKNTFIVRDQ